MILLLSIIAGLVLALIPNVIWFLCWIGCKIAGVVLPYKYFGISALVIAVIFWIALLYGYYIGRWKIESVKIEYTHKDIPMAFDGFKIVHISDLHMSTFDDSPEKFETFVNEVNRHSPDLICFTGDMVTFGRAEAEPYTDILLKMKARHGIISVLGNHDFMIYGFNKDLNRNQAVSDLEDYQEEELGWRVLRNEHFVIEAEDSTKITFLGVDNANFSNQGFRTIHRGDLKKAMEGTEGFRILLSHDPSHWRAEVVPQTDIQLTLSGHTHNAQIEVFGWSPAQWTFNETAGRYDHEEQTLYINKGLGCTAPFRFGAHPEVTVITLKPAEL